MLYRSVGGDVSGWPIFDAAAPVLPGFAAPPGVRVLDAIFLKPFHKVWRESTKRRLFSKLSFSPGGAAVPQPNYG